MSTTMVNIRDKTMGSTGGRRANASMTENQKWFLQEQLKDIIINRHCS
jgi:hypothetical protein